MNIFELEMSADIEPDLFDFAEIQPVARPIEDSRSSRFVTFFFGDKLYGVAAEAVAEVAHPLPISPLPNGPDSLIGISPLRGEIVAVIDLRKLLSEVPLVSPGRSKFIVLRAKEDESQPAFPVDRMHEIVNIADSEIEPNSQADSFLAGRANISGTAVELIDVKRVTAALAP